MYLFSLTFVTSNDKYLFIIDQVSSNLNIFFCEHVILKFKILNFQDKMRENNQEKWVVCVKRDKEMYKLLLMRLKLILLNFEFGY